MDAKIINEGVRVECSATFSNAEFYMNPRGNFTLTFWHEDKKDFLSLVISPEEIVNFIDTLKMLVDKGETQAKVMDAYNKVSEMDKDD